MGAINYHQSIRCCSYIFDEGFHTPVKFSRHHPILYTARQSISLGKSPKSSTLPLRLDKQRKRRGVSKWKKTQRGTLAPCLLFLEHFCFFFYRRPASTSYRRFPWGPGGSVAFKLVLQESSDRTD